MKAGILNYPHDLPAREQAEFFHFANCCSPGGGRANAVPFLTRTLRQTPRNKSTIPAFSIATGSGRIHVRNESRAYFVVCRGRLGRLSDGIWRLIGRGQPGKSRRARRGQNGPRRPIALRRQPRFFCSQDVSGEQSRCLSVEFHVGPCAHDHGRGR